MPGIPEWVVTFGDMMSLLLTFFIMLVSMSELKEEERYQAMLESMRKQFGPQASQNTLPGDNTPKNSMMRCIASMGRAKRQDIMQGGNPVKAVTGENTTVQTIRPGKTSTKGGVIYFEELSDKLSPDREQQLRGIADHLRGKPQRIEIRGHASRKPPPDGDQWELAFHRAKRVKDYLIGQNIAPQRIRVSSAADTEPIDNGLNVESRKRNARVEVLMWDEPVISHQTI